MTEIVELTEAQRQRAQAFLEQFDLGGVQHPLHILDDWNSVQETIDYWGTQPPPGAEYTRERRYALATQSDVVRALHENLSGFRPADWAAFKLKRIKDRSQPTIHARLTSLQSRRYAL